MPTEEYAHISIHSTAVVDPGAKIGAGTKVWHFSHIYAGAEIGERCSFGQNTMVASGVRIGSNVKVQNNVAIYTGTTIEDDVFLGPSCVLTNVSNPRSQVVRQGIYEKTLIRRGATIGANATVVCGVTIGRYAFVAAGAVVTKNIPDYGCVRGVPGKQIGWMSRHGHPLEFDDQQIAVCPESALKYQRSEESQEVRVHCLDLDEELPLAPGLSVGQRDYRQYSQSRNVN